MARSPARAVVVALAFVALTAGGLAGAPSALADVTPSSTIGTFAGTGAAASTGDGGPATSAALNQPRGKLATGPDGSFYVADTFGNRIRRIAPDGTISTLAGTGVHGFGGDGGQASAASLRWPHDVDVDGGGTVWIADSANHRIRTVSPDGVIRTVVGTGVGGFNGDGLQGTATRISRPKAVLVTATHLWISDGDNHRIRRMDLATRVVTTVVGTGVGGYAGDGGPATRARIRAPRAIELDDAGVLYIADSKNNRIRRVGTDGVITTVAGTGVAGFGGDGGPAIRARLNVPRGLTVAGGVLYIADSDNSRVRRVDLSTGVITTLAGDGVRRFAGDGGPAIRASLRNPRGLSFDDRGRLLVADTMNNRIRVIASDG